MRPEQRDPALLWDMLQASRVIVRLCAGRSAETFATDEVLRLACERELITIGEAARGVSDTLRSAHAEIAWREIIGLRNLLVHEYLRIDAVSLWETVSVDLPALIDTLSKLLPPAPD